MDQSPCSKDPQAPAWRARVFLPALWVLLAAWFLYFAWPGLYAWFTPDDLMNLHGVAFRSPWEILTAKERPVANLVLKGLWPLFGLHPRPFRVFCFGLLLANLWLALRFFHAWTGAWRATVFAGLLVSYHAALQDLYFSGGTIYDLLCFAFFCAALAAFRPLVEPEAAVRPGRIAAVALLAALAGGSKEVAFALPLTMAVAALVWRAGRPAWLAVGASAAACWGVLAWAAWRAPVTANPAYQPEFTLAVLQARWTLLTGTLLYRGPEWSATAAWLLFAGSLLAAVWTRHRAAWLACMLIVVSPLPLLFLPQRSFYAFYVAYGGWCLLAGLVLDRLTRALQPRGWQLAAALAVALAVWLAPQHRWLSSWVREMYYQPYEARVVAPGNVLRRNLPPLPRGASIYFVDDPLPPKEEEEHLLAFLCRLKTNDGDLAVFRARNLDEPVPEAEWGQFTAVFRLTEKELVRIR